MAEIVSTTAKATEATITLLMLFLINAILSFLSLVFYVAGQPAHHGNTHHRNFSNNL
jgi:hypothetical protein